MFSMRRGSLPVRVVLRQVRRVARVRIFFIILLYSVALYVIFELATHPAIPALTILLTFGQITSQMQYFEIPWPKALARWMQVASLTFADLQILGLDCVARWDYFTRFAATMFAPFLWALLTGVAVVFRCWREIAHQAYLGVQRRRLIERRRKLMQYDVDGKKWSDLATERDGLPFDRVDLKGKGDDYTAMEKHLYGTSSNEGLRRRGFAEIVASQGGLDMKLKTSMERKKLARKMIKTREELEELQAKRIANNKIIRSNINRAIPSLIIVMWWGYSLLSRTVIEFFECKNNQEAVVLVADPQIQCNAGKHLEWKPVAFAGFALYPIGLFVAAAAWLYAHRSTSKTRPRVHVLASKASKTDREKAILVEHFEERHGMMYNSLRPHFYLWMCVDLGKKLTIIGVKAFFPNDTLMQSFVAMVLFVTFGVFSTRHPYVNANLNVAEMLATFMNAITLITGFYFQLGIMEAVSRDIATGVMLIGLASTTVVLVAIVAVEFFPWMKRLIFLLKYHTTNDVLKPDKIGTHESGPQGWSCYIWPSHSPFRYACWRAVHHPLFDRVVSLCLVFPGVSRHRTSALPRRFRLRRVHAHRLVQHRHQCPLCWRSLRQDLRLGFHPRRRRLSPRLAQLRRLFRRRRPVFPLHRQCHHQCPGRAKHEIAEIHSIGQVSIFPHRQQVFPLQLAALRRHLISWCSKPRRRIRPNSRNPSRAPGSSLNRPPRRPWSTTCACSNRTSYASPQG